MKIKQSSLVSAMKGPFTACCYLLVIYNKIADQRCIEKTVAATEIYIECFSVSIKVDKPNSSNITGKKENWIAFYSQQLHVWSVCYMSQKLSCYKICAVDSGEGFCVAMDRNTKIYLKRPPSTT